MNNINFSAVLKEARQGALVGLGIALTFFFINGGLRYPSIIFYFTLLGLTAGFSIAFFAELAQSLLREIIQDTVKSVIIETLVTYIISSGVFFIIFSTYNTIFSKDINIWLSFYFSLGIGVASVMVGLFFKFIKEKEDIIRLEKENRQLAVIKERNRIARELHDSVSQSLFGVNLQLNTLKYQVKNNPESIPPIIDQMQNMVAEAQTEMRLMIYELKPVALKEKGFFEAIEGLTNLFQTRYDLDIDCFLNGNPELVGSDLRLVFYRVLQESLNNIVKHAAANKVELTLSVDDERVKMLIYDDGKGFKLEDVDGTKSFGLQGMRERIEENNGQFEVNSRPGIGTQVEIESML